MNFLFPLYFLGLAALSIPIFLHFRAKNVRKQIPFSSTMFLDKTPVQEKRKSKLEHWLLLLLRCLILGLLAFCFARPFFKKEIPFLVRGDVEEVVLLIDRSASMRRGDLWEKAQDKAKSIIEKLNTRDRLQLVAFDENPVVLLSFETWVNEGSRAKELALAAIEDLEPTWKQTAMGEAVASAADVLANSAETSNAATRRVIIVGDLQKGLKLEELNQYPWPDDVELVTEALAPKDGNGNAFVQILPEAPEDNLMDAPARRVRITNHTDSGKTDFKLVWKTLEGTPASLPATFQVAPGTGKVVEAPLTTTGLPAPILELEGDTEDFDNKTYSGTPPEKPFRILYYGDDDPVSTQAELFFFQRALIPTKTFRPELTHRRSDQSLEDIDFSLLDFVVVADPPANDNITRIGEYLEEGGRALFVMRTTASAAALGALLDEKDLAAEEMQMPNYALIGEVNRKHPVLSPFSDARFGDFSKVHLWRYRKLPTDLLDRENIVSLARVSGGDPLWFEAAKGKGNLVVFTTGWNRTDSQLALSTKFIPLIYMVLHRSSVTRDPVLRVGDPIPLPAEGLTAVVTPGGEEVVPEKGANRFTATDEPGIYQLVMGDNRRAVAINLHPAESNPEAVTEGDLQEMIEKPEDPALAGENGAREKKGHLPDSEQEARQKLWHMLLLGVMALVLVEILYSAWCHRKASTQLQETTS